MKTIKRILLLLILSLSACNFNKVEKIEKPEEPQKEEVKIITMGMKNVDFELNPILAKKESDIILSELLFASLITNDKTGNPMPYIAKSWKFSEDSKSLTFDLRDDVYFSDGSKLTAQDVIHTYMAIGDSSYNGPYKEYVKALKGMKEYADNKGEFVALSSENENTVTFHFNNSNENNIWRANIPILSKAHYKDIRGNIEKLKKLNKNPIGAGPFKLKEFKDDEIIMEVNDKYFYDKPKVEAIKFLKLAPQDILPALRDGTIDINLNFNFSKLNKKIISDTLGENINILEYPKGDYSYISLNLKGEVFANKNVRKALMFGINRKAFIEDYYGLNGARLINNSFSADSWVYDEESEKKLEQYDYDEEKANELLEKEGYIRNSNGIREKDGKVLSIRISSYKNVDWISKFVPVLKDNWSKLGIKVESEYLDFDSMEKIIADQKYQARIGSWKYNLDPDQSAVFHSMEMFKGGNNSQGFNNKLSDELLKKAGKSKDSKERIKLYSDWSKLINDELPYLFLYNPNKMDLVRKQITGLENLSTFVKFSNPAVITKLEKKN